MALTDLTRISTSGIATGTSLSGAILHGDAHFRGDQVGVTSALFDSSERELNLKDNVKLTFGDKSSGDLKIYHDGEHSYIDDAGTGNVKIRSAVVQITNLASNKTSAVFSSAAGQTLKFNNSTKFETTNHGAVVTGILTATEFSGPVVGNTSNASGISTFYDLRVSNNLTVEGTTTTLDTDLTAVDRIEVGANSNSVVGIAVTQSGTADIVNLFDGGTEIVEVASSTNAVKVTHSGGYGLRVQRGSKFLDFNGDWATSGNTAINAGASGIRFYYGDSSDGIQFNTGSGDDKVRIKSDGKVGIGTTNPYTTGAVSSHKLTIAGDDVLGIGRANTDMFYVRREYTAGKYTLQTINGGNDGSFLLQPYGGRVGIGTNNPARDFHVTGTSRLEQLDVVGFATFGSAGTRFYHHTPRIEMPGNATATLSFVNATTGTTNSDGMLMGFSSSSEVGFINVNESAHGFVLKTGGSGAGNERLRVSGVGTVSIRYGSEEMILANPNGSVFLYNDNAPKFRTYSEGIQVLGAEGGNAAILMKGDEGDDNNDNYRLIVGDGTSFYLQNYASGSWETNIKATGDGNVELYHNNLRKLSTVSTGIEIHANEANNANIYMTADEGDDNGDQWILQSQASTNNFNFYNDTSGSAAVKLSIKPNGDVGFIGDLLVPDNITHSGDTNTKIRFPAADTITAETGGTEKVRIDTNGKVGIGTISPKHQLEVFSGYAGRPTFGHTGGYGGVQIAGPQPGSGAALMFTRGYHLVGGGTTTYSLFLNGTTQNLHFISGDPSEHLTKTRLLLKSNGNVGIGTDNPDEDLVIVDVSPSIKLTSTSTVGNTNIYFGDTGGTTQGQIQYHNNGDFFRFFTNGSNERLRITSTGLVGINTSIPSGRLNLVGSDSQIFNIVQDTGDLTIRLNDRGSSSSYIKIPDGSGALTFETGGSESLRIDSSGNVTFTGTTGNSSPRFTIKHNNADVEGEVIRFARTDLNTIRYHSIKAKHSGNSLSNYISVNVHDGGGSPYTSQTEVARFLGAGGMTFNGDTAAANALDDYETGSFTPVMYGHTTGTGSDTVSGSGYYVKVGDMCTIALVFSNKNGTGLPTGENLYISGLPFAFKSGPSNQTSGVPFTYNVDFNPSHIYTFIGGNNITYLRGYLSRAASTWVPWSTNDWRVSTFYMYLNMTYIAT